MRFREEVINIQFAYLLREYGLEANPETIEKGGFPDVIINMGGLKVIVEGRFGNRESLKRDVKERIENGMADISIGIFYPQKIKEAASLDQLRDKISSVIYDGVVCYFERTGLVLKEFNDMTLNNVVETLNNIFHLYVKNDLVRAFVVKVEETIESVANTAVNVGLFFQSDALVERLKQTLGIRKEESEKKKRAKSKLLKLDKDLLRIAVFILFDALVFHEALAGSRPTIKSLRRAIHPYQRFLENEWAEILRIDYEPVFQIAKEILTDFPSSPETERILKKIMDVAIAAISSGILLKHDFMGRIYHKLLLRTTGEYYATYYTSIPAAWLLANLIFKTPKSEWDFENPINMRVIDPACGSGTLLSAAYMAIKDMHILSRPTKLDLLSLHQTFIEHILYGWDILDYASHLTLTTLALHNYRATFSKSNIYTLPAGIGKSRKIHFGSLDHLWSQMDLIGRGFVDSTVQKNMEGEKEVHITPPECDVVIMNPPFSRSANPKVKFGYSEDDIKKAMDNELKKLTRILGMEGIGQAGLGAYFILLGDKLLRAGGRMGIVIPRAILSGVSWDKIRKFLSGNYGIKYIVSNHDPGDKEQGVEPWNWSENTDLSEVLIVVEKRKEEKEMFRDNVLYVNLWNKPKNEVESLLITQQIIKGSAHLRATLYDDNWEILRLNNKEVGCMYYVPQVAIRTNWLPPCLFANPNLNKFLLTEIPTLFAGLLVPLQTVANHMGMDCGTISKHFKPTSVQTMNKVIWGYTIRMDKIDASSYIQFAYSSTPLENPKKGNLLVPYSMYLQNHKVVVFLANTDVLSNAFWSIKLDDSAYAKLTTLWLNSTFGFLFLLSVGIASRGYHFEFKQDNLRNLLVLKESCIANSKINAFFRAIHNSSFEPFAEEFNRAAQGNGIRKQIDDFFIRELKLTVNLSSYYDLLSTEPMFTLERL